MATSHANLTIREATAEDLPALARLHVVTWNATYAPVVGPTYETRERQWRDAFTSGERGWFCFVVQGTDGVLVGFAQAYRSDTPDYEGELRKIHLLREYQRIGLGRRLVGHIARKFLSQGITSMWLWGDPNNPAQKAWLAMGAVKTDDDPRKGNYGWRDLKPLASFPP